MSFKEQLKADLILVEEALDKYLEVKDDKFPKLFEALHSKYDMKRNLMEHCVFAFHIEILLPIVHQKLSLVLLFLD